MKAKLFYILILGLLFLHPNHIRALDLKESSSSGFSYNKTYRVNAAVTQDLKYSKTFFGAAVFCDDDLSADLDLEDDDDVSFSARKKFSFEKTPLFFSSHCEQHFCGPPFKNFRSHYLYHLPSFHFISLRVFRL